jgi:hypothetical protein
MKKEALGEGLSSIHRCEYIFLIKWSRLGITETTHHKVNAFNLKSKRNIVPRIISSIIN